MLLIGSVARDIGLSKFESLKSYLDLDFFCSKDQAKQLIRKLVADGNSLRKFSIEDTQGFVELAHKETGKVIIEFSFTDSEDALCKNNLAFLNHHAAHSAHSDFCVLNILGTEESVLIAPLEVLYLLKMSHKYKKNSLHFEKTRKDILLFESLGYNLEKVKQTNPGFYSLFEERYQITHNNKLPRLNQSKDNFFTDSVPYKYDHDSLHLAVKHLDKPAYEYYKEDNQEVFCSKEKFENCPDVVKLYGVLEESYVLALERSVIPFNTDPEKAFVFALQKVCTSITSGWFREYAWVNYDKVKSMYHSSYVEKFKNNLAKGLVLPYNRDLIQSSN